MPFELESMTKVRVLDVRTLAAKDRKAKAQKDRRMRAAANATEPRPVQA